MTPVSISQSGAVQGGGQVPGHQHRGGTRDGQPPEQRRSDEGDFYQTHPGGQSCWTQRDPEDRRQDRGGKGIWVSDLFY